MDEGGRHDGSFDSSRVSARGCGHHRCRGGCGNARMLAKGGAPGGEARRAGLGGRSRLRDRWHGCGGTFRRLRPVGLKNLGSALILEAAPEDLRGGNSRVCGQGTFCPTSVEGAIEYQTDLDTSVCGRGRSSCRRGPRTSAKTAPGFPKNAEPTSNSSSRPSSRKQRLPTPPVTTPPKQSATTRGAGGIWKALEDTVASFGTPLYYDARAVLLVHDPQTKEVYGVETEDGRSVQGQQGRHLGLRRLRVEQRHDGPVLHLRFRRGLRHRNHVQPRRRHRDRRRTWAHSCGI